MLKQTNVSSAKRDSTFAHAHGDWVDTTVHSPGYEQCLIPESSLLSELFEDIRLQGSSYELLHPPFADRTELEGESDLTGLAVIDGSAELVWGNGEVERLELFDFILLTPGQAFKLRAVTGQDRCTIGHISYKLDLSRARLLFRLLPRSLVMHNVTSQEVSWQMTLAHLVAEPPGSFCPANAAISRRLVEAGLIGIIQMFLARNAQLGHLIDPRMARIAPSLRAMHRLPEGTWTIASLAKLSAMSRTSFVATFTESTGETPGHYLALLRLERARDLLQRSSLPMAEVAHRAGYGSDVAFIRAFRRQFGVSPGRFRADFH